MKPTVLILSAYPFKKPLHGGQIRLANIAKMYESAGWQVNSIAIYDPKGYSKEAVGARDIPFSSDPTWRYFQGRSIPLIEDLLTCSYAESDNGGFPLIMRLLPQNIDVIHVEQPWLWPLARRIRSSLGDNLMVTVYGSQNIEAPLKREILSSYDIHDVEDVIDTINMLEQNAAQEADLSLAVTQSDLDVLSRYGAKFTLLAPNGVKPWQARNADLEKWSKKLPASPWLLYIASAHPPNFSGLTKIVGDSLGFIPPDSRLVVAGSVSEHIHRVLKETKWHHLNASRLQLLYTLSDRDLAAVKELAHVFVIPIHHGGGSNLKTAEAIYSGSYVLGTSSAFRGYEQLMHLPEVFTADSPLEFQTLIRDILQRPSPPSKTDKGTDRQTLRWDKCLALIPETVRSIMENKHG